MQNSGKRILIYDDEAFSALKESTQGIFIEKTDHQTPFLENLSLDLKEGDTCILFLSDDQLKITINEIKNTGCTIGFVSHPKSSNAINGFSLNKDPEKSFSEALESERAIEPDLLLCNDEIILNYFAVGEIMSFLSSNGNKANIFGKVKRFFQFAKKLKNIRASLFTFKVEDKDEFETAITDILVVQHGKNSMVSRILSEEKYSNNGLLYCFIFSPRSILQLIKAYFLKLFLGAEQKNQAFNFLGELKVSELKLSSNNEFSYDVDGLIKSTTELNFRIEKGVKIIPAKTVEFEESETKKVFKINNLPQGTVKKEVARKRLPWISHASTEEYKDLFTQLRENSRPSQNYVVLMTLSVILATLGIFANSSPVIIGAMILAPLMSPIISLSMGVLRQDRSLIKRSLITVVVGLFIGYLFAIILTFITPINNMNIEITSRIKPNIIDLGIAVISGAAGAYAHSREEIAKTLAGVAISVALVPPLAVSGIGIAWLNWEVFFGAFLLVITNLTGMVLAGALTFLFTGYSPFRLARKGVLISFFVVLSLSVPLGYGFFKVVQENQIIQSVNHKKINNIEIENVKVIGNKPLMMSLDLIVKEYPTEVEIENVKQKISKIIGEEVELEIGIRLRR
ncbi:MAG: TIGR00341 family protein [Fluviicola sp.]|nr:MAG: TIGR00341 family protein [Fluviicola sp.]